MAKKMLEEINGYSYNHQRIRVSYRSYSWSAIYDLFYLGFITNNIKKKLSETSVTLIELIDRIRMLDNDIIRLQQKLDTVIELRESDKHEKKNK